MLAAPVWVVTLYVSPLPELNLNAAASSVGIEIIYPLALVAVSLLPEKDAPTFFVFNAVTKLSRVVDEFAVTTTVPLLVEIV